MRIRKRRFIVSISANLGVGLIVGSILFPLTTENVSLGKALFAVTALTFGVVLIAAAVIFYE